jgi:hypothetical protein
MYKAQPSREPDDTDVLFVYSVNAFDIESLAHTLTIHRCADSISPALDLMRYGYIAKPPSRPTIAVLVKTLIFCTVSASEKRRTA